MLMTVNHVCMAGPVNMQLPCHRLAALLCQHSSPVAQHNLYGLQAAAMQVAVRGVTGVGVATTMVNASSQLA